MRVEIANPPVEYPVTVYVGDVEYVTVQATPDDLEDLVVGMLFGEGLIAGPADLAQVVAEPGRGLAWADLRPGLPPAAGGLPPAAGRPAPGSGGPAPLPPGVRVRPAELAAYMGLMLRSAERYRATRGIHSAMAARPATGEWLVREDIGRHNAVDKVIGAALRRGWPGPELVICTSGRISHDMCSRLARLGAGIAASRTAATDRACELADRLGMDLVGYVRTAGRYRLYTAGRRLLAE